MSYVYETEKPWLFTNKGQSAVIKATLQARELLNVAGAFKAFSVLKNIQYDDMWKGLSILDRLVELGIVREVTSNCHGQDRVFVEA
jgi:hypothetical protein